MVNKNALVKTSRDREKIIPYKTLSTFCGMFGTSKLEKGVFVTDTYNICKEVEASQQRD